MSDDLLTYLSSLQFVRGDLMRLAFSSMAAILFLQSGLDKVIHWRGEKTFLTGHFAKSILRGLVPFMLPVLTAVELAAGSLSAIGFFQVLLGTGKGAGTLGLFFGTAAIMLLFLGQRLAKDYAGAAALVPYFLLMAAGLYFFTGW